MQVEDIQRIKQSRDISIDDKKDFLAQKLDTIIEELNNKKQDIDNITLQTESQLDKYRIMLSAVEGLLRKS